MQNTKRYIFILCAIALLSLQACVAHTTFPTSERLEEVRTAHSERLAQELNDMRLKTDEPIFIRIFKEESMLEIWKYDPHIKHYRLFRSYPVCNYSGELGPKRREGDKQAPEGFYWIEASQLNPNSQYHLSANIGYPNRFDLVYGLTGSNIMIHGGCESIGCYAMGDGAIEEIYLLSEWSLKHNSGTVPVHIFPFRMTDENMQKHIGSPWIRFWKNLKVGYDMFEKDRMPPEEVEVSYGQGYGKYIFESGRKKSFF